MRQACQARPHQAGGAALIVLIVIAVLAAVAYLGYRAFGFYQQRVAPVVEQVSRVAGGLNPYTVTKDPNEVAGWLKNSFRIAPPPGYVGAFGLNVEFLGRKHMQLMALIPQGVRPADIFEGGRGEIRFNPGSSTIFLAAKSDRGDRDHMRDGIARMVAGEGLSEPMKEVYVEAGERKVAAYRGAVQNYGAWNTIVYVFLDDGRMLHAAGPRGSFDEQALVGVLAALVAAHPANELLYQHPKPPPASAAGMDPCGIAGLPAEFDVVVVSVRKGSRPLDIAIDKSGSDVTQEDVVVGATPRPVVLVLTGHDPIVWNVGRTPQAQLAGVLAQGYHRQAVIGLPKATRVVSYSTADGPNACPHFRAGKAEGPEYVAVQRRVRELFGRGIASFITNKAGGRFAVGEVNGEPMYSADTPLKSVALPGDQLPGGLKGLERLVKDGAIRLAVDEEVADWVAGAAARQGQPLERYRRAMDWRLGNGQVYVVLKPFDLPEGLAGAHARTFILPAGVARPGGPQGHCTFLQMEAFQCYGGGCR